MHSLKALKRITAISLAAGLLATAAVAGPAAAKQDTGCMQAGMKTLQSARLLDDVARGGIAIETAVGLGVTVRPGADISGVPNPIPFSLLLADHRAGEGSLFVYPWC
jgi:hypothetical protein